MFGESCPFWRIISNRISCSRALRRNAAIDEVRRSSGGGGVVLELTFVSWADAGWWDGDETLIGVNGAEVDDLLESVGEIGGETESAALTGIEDKYSDGDFVAKDGWFGGRWAAEMLASNVWKEAVAGE